MQTLVHNPVIPGYHPDPSICRVDDTYYLVTSSFEFSPGVPIFSSHNLIDWELIGHCLTRPSQLPLKNCQVSEGIYAPTIRYHDGYFFMVTTNVSGGGNFIVHTTDPAGEWSEPAWVSQGGIDPSLLFFQDKVYFVSNGDCHGNSGIFLCEVNPFTGEMLTDSILISKGCGGKYPEAPHMYYIDGYFYLMLAEGGTEYGHMVTMQRSTSPYGPYVPSPHNPILSNREQPIGPNCISCTGHADLIQDQNGNWWLTALGVRTISTNSNRLLLHNLGRETFLAPLYWQDGWCIAGNNGILEMEFSAELPDCDFKEDIPPGDTVKSPLFIEDFQGKTWDLEFTQIRNPSRILYKLNSQEGTLTLYGKDSLCTPLISPTFLGIRQNSFCQRASVKVSCSSSDENGLAGLTVYYNNEHHYDIGIRIKENAKILIFRRQIYDLIKEEVLFPVPDPEIQLEIIADKNYYSFYYFSSSGDHIFLGKGATAALCTEITRHMTFTGTFFGMFAEHATAAFRCFVRETLEK